MNRLDAPNLQAIADAVPDAFAICVLMTGSLVEARRLIRTLVRQALNVGLTDREAAVRSMRHHAILLSRSIPHVQPSSLFDHATELRPAWLATLKLPRQQVEAFLLAHALGLPPREIGIAMDCSTTAASVHLEKALTELRPLVGDRLDKYTAELRQLGSRLREVEDPLGFVRKHARPLKTRRSLRKLLRLCLWLALLTAAGFVLWKFWQVWNA